jgi:hypothetical protein
VKPVSWLDLEAFEQPAGRMPLPERTAPVPRRAREAPTPVTEPSYTADTAARKRLIDQMVPIARSLAMRARTAGIIVADIRKAAAERNIITSAERDRSLSFIWQVPGAAGLVAKGSERRRSDIGISHGNLQQVWVLPEFAP